MISRHKLTILFAVIVILTVSAFIFIPLFKKQSRYAFKYEHIQINGPKYQIKCAFLPAKKQSSKGSVLVVYLHGLFSNCGQGFEIPSKYPFAFGTTEAFPNISFFSCDYGRLGSWCNSEGYEDITCCIEEISKRHPVSKIIMTGTSMGGCTALTYATNAPKDIRDKIIGVLAIYAAGDLTRLYEETKSIEVREALEKAFDGTPIKAKELYSKASFIPNLPKLSPGTRVYIISALKDKVIPPKLQNELVEKLQATNIPTRIKFLPCYHVAVPHY